MSSSASRSLPLLPRSPQTRASRRHTLVAFALVAAMIAFVGAVVAAVIINKPPPVDPKTGCALDGVDQLVEIAFDPSDPIPKDEQPAVVAEIGRRAQALPVGSRLTLRALVPRSAKAAKPLFDQCKPRDGSSVSVWFGNPAMQDAIFAKAFAVPVEQAQQRIAEAKGQSDSSPIIQALADIATDPAAAQARHRSLVVVGDMLENSAICNMYRAPCDFAAVERAGFKAVRDLKGRLAGAEVTLLQIRRAEVGRYQTPAQHAFWTALMAYAGMRPEQLRFERL